MAVLGFVASLLVHRWLVPHFSGDADEAVYVLQAKMLESGRITLSARDHGLFFRPWLTGVHDGRIFTQYLPSWPAALALSDSVFGTMVIAPAAMVSVWIVGTYAMAKELLGERRTALLAAALVLFCPLVLLHGSLYLSYVFSAALLTGGAALLLHGYRVSSRLELVLAGGAFGLVLLARPFDVFLFGFPVAVYLGGRHWRERSKLARAAGSGLLGFGPFVVVLLAYDTRVTGSALRLPIPASDPLNTFGFGLRRILPDQPPGLYSFGTAMEAMRDNVSGLVSWLPGGVLLVALALAGCLLRGRRPERLLLLALTVSFPIGYLMWWATTWSALGATNGIGPHYYLPLLAPLAVLAASSLDRLARVHRFLPGVALVACIAIAVPSLGPKIEEQRVVNFIHDQVAGSLPPRMPTPAVVIVRDGDDSQYVAVPHQFLADDVQLHQRILYAAPRGGPEHLLASALPGRRLFRLNLREARRSDELFGPYGTITELHTTRARRLRVRQSITNTSDHPNVVAYVGDTTRTVDTHSARGRTYTVDWLVGPSADGGAMPISSDQLLTLGAAFSDDGNPETAERWEERVSIGPVADQVEAQTPGYEWRYVQFPNGRLWLQAPVGDTLAIDAVPSP